MSKSEIFKRKKVPFATEFSPTRMKKLEAAAARRGTTVEEVVQEATRVLLDLDREGIKTDTFSLELVGQLIHTLRDHDGVRISHTVYADGEDQLNVRFPGYFGGYAGEVEQFYPVRSLVVSSPRIEKLGFETVPGRIRNSTGKSPHVLHPLLDVRRHLSKK